MTETIEIPEHFKAAWENDDGEAFHPNIDEKLDYLAVKLHRISESIERLDNFAFWTLLASASVWAIIVMVPILSGDKNAS